MAPKTFILVLSCDDKPGIVAAVTTELAGLGANIAESNQFWDTKTNSFFMRIAFQVAASVQASDVERALAPAVERFQIGRAHV